PKACSPRACALRVGREHGDGRYRPPETHIELLKLREELAPGHFGGCEIAHNDVGVRHHHLVVGSTVFTTFSTCVRMVEGSPPPSSASVADPRPPQPIIRRLRGDDRRPLSRRPDGWCYGPTVVMSRRQDLARGSGRCRSASARLRLEEARGLEFVPNGD